MPLWVIPLLYVVVSLIAAFTFPRFEFAALRTFQHEMSVASAQAFLSAVSSGMMALTAIVFSIAFLYVQYTATAYSKRLIMLIGRRPIIFHGLGLFVATFMYALGTLIFIDRSGTGWVPVISIAVVVVLVAASATLLAVLIHELSDLRITRILAIIGDQGRSVLSSAFEPAPQSDAARVGDLGRAPRPAMAGPSRALVHSGPPVVVRAVDRAALLQLATNDDCRVEVVRAVGDSVSDGAVLLRLFGANAEASADDALRRALDLGSERSFARDVKYAMRLLVDTAIMALSPAVNDPTTAVQTVDQLQDLLHRLGSGRLDRGLLLDASGTVRVLYPVPTWHDYLSLSFDEIRQYGASSLQVVRRLRSALLELAATVTDDHRPAVEQYLAHLDAGVVQSPFDEIDKATALGADPQGLGLTRI